MNLIILRDMRYLWFSIFIFVVFNISGQNQDSYKLDWVKSMGGTSFDYSNSIAVDNNGNTIITGEFRNIADFDPSSGLFEFTSFGIRDIFVVKISPEGQVLWAKQFGGTENEYSNSITTDNDGNIYFTGSFNGTADFDPGPGQALLTTPHSAENSFICKLDPSGNLVFVKHIMPDMSFPGHPSSAGKSIKIDSNGNIIVAGTFHGGNDFNPGTEQFILANTQYESIYLLKLTANGDFVWANRMGGANINKNALEIDNNNNVLITGVFNETADFDPGPNNFFMTSEEWDDIFITKINSSGAFVWAKQFSCELISSNAIVTDFLGNVYITGFFQLTADFDPGPNFYELTSRGSSDIFLAKLNEDGEFVWAKQFGAGGYNASQGGYALATTDSDTSIYLAGIFNWQVDFDPGQNSHFLYSNGGLDIFVAKYNSHGNFIWAANMGGPGENDFSSGIQTDNNSNIYLTGFFQNTADFNPGFQKTLLTSKGQTDAFSLKMSPCIKVEYVLNQTVCDSITINDSTYYESGVYYQYFVNSLGCDSILKIDLTVNNSISFLNQPQDAIRCQGAFIDLFAEAVGTEPITYQWYKNDTILPNETTNTFHYNGVNMSHDGIYKCELTNICGIVMSDEAAVKIINISLNYTNNVTFCNDSSVQLEVVATSNYPEESGSFTYNWSPSEGLSSTNIYNPTAQPDNPLQYNVEIRDQNHCNANADIYVVPIIPIQINSQPTDITNICLDDNFFLSVNFSGSNPHNIQWYKDGDSIHFGTNHHIDFYNVDLSYQGAYYCEISNSCNTVVSDTARVNVIEILVNAGSDVTMCKGLYTDLNVIATSNHPFESGNLQYDWTPWQGLSSIQGENVTANPTYTVTYTVEVTDILNCKGSDSVTVNIILPYANEEICLVTVDTLSWKNMIMWEKTPDEGTIGYNVYKEVATNVYSVIGFVDYSNPSFFIDYYSQPESFASRYKISVLDTCGNESDKSYYHNTMNLTIASNGSTMGLNWSHYNDESGEFVPSLYYIYRGTTPFNMTLLASVPGSVNSYNDNNVFTVYHYIIGVMRPGGCNTSKDSDLISFSNRKDNSTLVNIEALKYQSGLINIAPNPMNTHTVLNIPNFAHNTNYINNYMLTISDITGKIVKTMNASDIIQYVNNNAATNNLNIEISRGELNSGIYFIELMLDRTYRGKFVIE